MLHCSNVLASQKFVEGLSLYCSTLVTAHASHGPSDFAPDKGESSVTASALEGWGWVAAPILLSIMLVAMFVGPHESYSLSSPARSPAPTEAVLQPLPTVRLLRQRGMQIVVAIPAETSDSDLLRVLDDLRVKAESARLSELGIKTAKQASSPPRGKILIFRTEGKAIPALSQNDADLKWNGRTTTATIRRPDGTRVPAFASVR